jgi:hypothetical protein
MANNPKVTVIGIDFTYRTVTSQSFDLGAPISYDNARLAHERLALQLYQQKNFKSERMLIIFEDNVLCDIDIDSELFEPI